MITKNDYLEYAKKVSNIVWKKYNNLEVKGDSGYLAYLAYIDAAIFKHQGISLHGERAKRAIMELERNKEFRKESKAFDFLFEPYPYLKAYEILDQVGMISPEEKLFIMHNVEVAIKEAMDYPEWGTHNRALLRALTIISGSRLFPEHSKSKTWKRIAETVAEDSFGQWTIEDGSTYNPIWLNAIFEYADITNRTEIINSSFTTRYYCDFFLQLLSPKGIVAEFGDGRWGTQWCKYVSCFERGASIFKDGRLKYAAHKFFEESSKLDDGCSGETLKMTIALIDSFEWADDSIAEMKPTGKSTEVMDDVIGKKIVFRNNWEDDGTFLMLNYKDEGEGSYLTRSHIRDTLFVTAEKAHHGHCDENSICLLVDKGSILLHDGGYRTNMCYVGAYRADYYHNKLLARKGIYYEKEGILDFYRNFRNYNPVTTQKIFFYCFDKMDVSRTKVHDKLHGVETERCIYYLIEVNCFVVIDLVKALEDGEYTYGPLYYSRTIEPVGENSFLTGYDYIGSDYWDEMPNNANRKLLIHYPMNRYPTKTQTIHRSYTKETAVQQYRSAWQRKDEIIPMVSILYPTDGAEEDVQNFMKSVSVSFDEKGNGLTVEIQQNDSVYVLGTKLDLRYGIVDLNMRPIYKYETGAVDYKDFKTDGDFCFAKVHESQVEYGFINATKIEYDAVTMFEAGVYPHYQINLSNTDASSKWKRWESIFDRNAPKLNEGERPY
ncbi:MAG: hypothetical protein WCN92_10360 [Eubacteriales bacterium]